MCRGLLDRESQRGEDGVKYFRNILRLLSIKGASSVSGDVLFIREKRENMEMVKWIGKILLLFKRLKDSWMDMIPTNNMSETRRQNQYHVDVARENEERRSRSHEFLNPDDPETREEWNVTQVAAHERLFSFSKKLTTLMFTISSDLSEAQTDRLTSFPSTDLMCL